MRGAIRVAGKPSSFAADELLDDAHVVRSGVAAKMHAKPKSSGK